jgi:organic hydroperoxide reductase OsmC/OhrA
MVHAYHAVLGWQGSTGDGYDGYDRHHVVSCPPAGERLNLSADPAFTGSADRLNPEQLLVAAAASCQLLSFLAVAARARIDVVAYEDDAEAHMPEGDPPMRITTIVLRPRITVRGEVDAGRLQHLVEVAHRACFIANSLTSAVEIRATFVES